ncbi:hypothetical protein MJM45_31010, partial [Salmonella enterica subsp. enterica serovar Kentucky]|nr:hypothetical protein [Salmonella enterica subsp. enterica serovar Kentucky]
IDKNELVSCTIPTMRPPSPLSLAWHKFGGGKAVEDIVKLFTQHGGASALSGLQTVQS